MPTSATSKSSAAHAVSEWLRHALVRIDKRSWRTFLISLLALAAAFILAMYSTIFAQQGRVSATGICALTALGLAGYVAFTAVPYLARRTQIEWLQASLDYKITREGWTFILLILVLAVAGLNTGNNLLYLILSSLLASLLMSGMLSLGVLNGVVVDLEVPEHVFARRPMEACIVLVNLKKFFPSFSLTLQGSQQLKAESSEAQAPWRIVLPRAAVLGLISGILSTITLLLLWKWSSNFFGVRLRSLIGVGALSLGASFTMALLSLSYRERKSRKVTAAASRGKRGPDQQRQSLQGLRSRGILDQPHYFPFLERGGTIRRRVELVFPRRGRYREDGLNLSTRFPFGFLEKTMHMGISRSLLVYPAVKPTARFFEILPLLTGELEAFQKGMGHDLYSIREMQGSDSVRHVDWKASARAGSMMVREFAREDDRRVQLVLDPRVGRSAGDSRGRAEAHAQFEAAVQLCASLAWHFHEVAAQFQFVCGDFSARVAPAAENIYEILEHLAEVTSVEEPPDTPLFSSEEENVFRVICTGISPERITAAITQRTHFIFFSTLDPAE